MPQSASLVHAAPLKAQWPSVVVVLVVVTVVVVGALVLVEVEQ
jgi:hypothetical protein